MRWRDRNWSERPRRPKAKTLDAAANDKLLARMTKAVADSPVLTGLGVVVRGERGRFYVERPGSETLARITPLADTFLLEVEGRSKWSEVARGTPGKLMKTIAGDTTGRFHGLG